MQAIDKSQFTESAFSNERNILDSEMSESECSSDVESETSDDIDLPLLEYARRHGLSQDYTSIYPLDPRILGEISRGSTPDETGMPQLQLPSGFGIDEKPWLDKGSAIFLRDTISIQIVDDEHAPISNYETIKSFRAESPLLQTDARLDLKQFTLKRKESEAPDARFSSHEDDDRLDMEVAWLDHEMLKVKNREISSERLQLVQSDIEFLRAACVDTFTDADEDDIGAGELANLKAVKLDPETSPLLPPSSPFSFSIPESATGCMDLATSPLDPTAGELEELDQILLREDVFTPEDDVHSIYIVGETRSPSISTADIGSSLSTKRQRADDFKEEVPLSPISSQRSPFKKLKTVSFSEILTTMIPDNARHFSPQEHDSSEEGCGQFFEEIIKQAAEAAIYETEHEQLSEADSTMRVEVPPVDQTAPLMPWDVSSCTGQTDHTEDQTLLKRHRGVFPTLKHGMLRNEKLWPGSAELDQDVVVWEPFPAHMGKVSLEEQFDDGSLDRYMAGLSFHDGPAPMSWKPEGLRALDFMDDEEEEIKPADPKTFSQIERPCEDLETLIRRRQQAMMTAQLSPKTSSSTLPTTIMKEGLRDSLVSRWSKAKTDHPSSALNAQPIDGNMFSATNSLGRFMQVQTGVVPTVELPPKLPYKKENKYETRPTTYLSGNAPVETQFESTLTAPIPILKDSTATASPRSFILSSTILSHRNLLRHIDQLYPAAILIERDFSSRSSMLGIGSYSNLDEADLIISPGVGLVITTIQQVKQKPLPGQVNRGGVRERIACVARRYEQLLVLVSEGAPWSEQESDVLPIRGLDQRDCDALVALTTFVVELDAQVQIMYVPGGEVTLASWAVSCMVKYGTDDPGVKLVQDETLWELFLRSAGLNAYAAQAVLALLKASFALKNPQGLQRHIGKNAYGLSAFIQMSSQERIKCFGRIIGGDRLLDRVSNVIDQGWRFNGRV